MDAVLFEFVLGQLAATNSVAAKSTAAGALAKARLSTEQLSALAESMKQAGPLDLPKLLSAFERSEDEALGLKLVAALKESPGAAALRAEVLKPRITNFPAVVQQRADELLASLNKDAAQQKEEIERLLPALKDGDVRRGQSVFNSQKTACASCHAIGYLGGKVGPDLTRIGQIRNERDLLEALVFPSASFVRSYEPVVVATKEGEEFSGVLRKDAPDEVVLATGPDTEARVARNDITDMRPGSVSVMPSGLVEQLSKQELADLLAFLRATRW
jgi:putative heme-binding domain-containing protein